jgi:hypothetical protein
LSTSGAVFAVDFDHGTPHQLVFSDLVLFRMRINLCFVSKNICCEGDPLEKGSPLALPS